MANTGLFKLGLIGVYNDVVREEGVAVEFCAPETTRPLLRAVGLSFPPSRAFELPAFPQASNLICKVTSPRYHFRQSGFFTMIDGESVTRDLTMLRNGREWAPRFVRWNDLPDRFDRLKRVLDRSLDLRLRKTTVTIPTVTSENYDGVADSASDRVAQAKAGLLNLFAKLSSMTAPGTRRDWFSFVGRILEVDRERIIAVVDEKCAQAVRAIRDNIDAHEHYKHTPHANHHGNMPLTYGVAKSKMFSIKSDERNGNVQLTIGPGTDPVTGAPAFILDADIDENGTLIPHLVDALFRHRITGGTHPFDIHEYLALTQPTTPIGYELV